MLLRGAIVEWFTSRARWTVWHRWFAWYPVHIHPAGYVWWEVVERRGESIGGDAWVWDYRIPTAKEAGS